MHTEEIAQRVRCCGCGGPVGRVNVVETDYRAAWPYPRSGNVLTGDDGRAVAIACDACVEAGTGAITRAVEFRGDEVIYHPLDSLDRLPPPPSYVLVKGPGGLVGIKCLYCRNTSFHPDDVRQRYCGHCKKWHLCDASP